MKWTHKFWLYVLSYLGALACAPEDEPEPDAAADPPADEDAPAGPLEMAGADWDEEDEELDEARRAEREDDEEAEPDADDAPDEPDADEEEEEPEEPAADPGKQPQSTKQPDAADEDEAEFNRELSELEALAGQNQQPAGQVQQPQTMPGLQPPPPGYGYAMTQYGLTLVPLQQHPSPYAPNPQLTPQPYVPAQPPGQQFDPEAPVTWQDLQQREALIRHQASLQTQQAVQQAQANAKVQQMVEGHLDRFRLTRDQEGVMRGAVRDAIMRELESIPNGWTDADFKRVAPTVTHRFYQATNWRKGKGQPADKSPPTGKPNPKPQPDVQPTRAPRRPLTRAEQIRQEEREIEKVLKGQTRRGKRR